MRYSAPKIYNTVEAISLIQSIFSCPTCKVSDVYLDTNFYPQWCTINAYEADE